MASYTRNITISKGTDFYTDYILSNPDGSALDLTNHTLTAKLRKHPSSSETYSFIVSNISDGKIRVSMASSITSEIPIGRNVYDVIATDSNQITKKLIQGMVFVEDTISADYNVLLN